MTEWAYETDVLVVGSGAGGMSAAVVAADEGANVLVVEKSARYGGTTASSGGIIWVPNSPIGIACGLEDTPEEAVGYIAAVAGSDVPRERIQAFVDLSPRMLAYLGKHTGLVFNGVPYTDYHAELPGGKMGYRSHDVEPMDGRLLGDDLELMRPNHPQLNLLGLMPWTTTEAAIILLRYPGWEEAVRTVVLRYYSDMPFRLTSPRSRFLTGGNALIGWLKLALNERDVPLWLNSPLTDLIVEDGRVVGAVVNQDGVATRIRTRLGVIIGSGGFERSAELRAAHLPNSPDPSVSVGSPDNQGDSLAIAERVGAAIERIDSAWWTPTVSVPGEDRARPLFTERSLPGTIMVDRTGNRFTNEAASYHVVGQAMYDRNDPTGPPSTWVIFDGAFRAKFTMGPMTPLVTDEFLPESVNEILFKADTIGELAARIGLPVAAVEATVERFNANAAVGLDPDFERGHTPYDNLYGDPTVTPNPNLRPLDVPPFYAIATFPGDIGTNGGIVTDASAAVLDQQGRRIEGLYAVGNCAASMMGRSYPGAGATIGPALTFGYAAALDITSGRAGAGAASEGSVP